MSMEDPTRHKAELPLSLIESEILPRLPAKSVGRCMCVSKQWKSFLSAPTFARVHLNHVTINDYKLLQLDNDSTSNDVSILANKVRFDNSSDVFILASLDGLVCLASKKSTRLVFWNPLTGVHRKLSHIPTLRFSSVGAAGFYKDSSNDYKLLHLVLGGFWGAYIYSHRLDSWREVEFYFGSGIVCWCWSAATFCGQCLYFTVTAFRHWWIICFDIETENFRKIRFPPIPYGAKYDSGSLVILNGCIHLCVSYVLLGIKYIWLTHAELWRMDGDDGWVKVAALSDPIPLYKEFTMPHICTLSIGNWVAVLDEENNSLKKVNMEDFTTHYPYFCSPSEAYRSRRMIYVETLVSPMNM